jgi:hypothetical protein
VHLYYEQSPIDGRVHQQNVALLQAALIGVNLPSFSAQYPGTFEPSDQYALTPGGSLLPRMTVIQSGTSSELLIVLNGMQAYDKVAAVVTGWSDPSFNNDGSIYPYETAAILLARVLPNNGPGFRWGNVTIIGHSYGGAVAMHLAELVPGVGENTDLKIYTYGAPKHTVRANHGGQFVTDTRRVFLATDPVPCMPLGPSDASNIWALFGVPTARSWARWRHNSSGLIFGTGYVTLQPAPNPPYQDSWSLYFSLAGWVTGTNCFGNAKHTLSEYYAAMVSVPLVTVATQSPETVSANNPIAVHSAVYAQNREAAEVQIGNTVAANPSAAVIGILSGTPQIPGQRFYGRRVGTEQRIYYDGEIVSFARTLRQRRSLVRALNASIP